ncbi:MAG TPA: LPS export ABC transporter periplasmic protein LptC, partial [Armatimonadota bacterium]|nr:LPS export ABC transporter periplasmic protein LptC [Armatimonadota bacterium]
DGKPVAAFTAERAIMHMQTKDLDVEGQVLVESLDREEKVVFSTRNMHWSARDERLTCPNPVEVTQPGVLLRGSSMVADARLRKLSLDGGVYLEADAEKVEKGLGVSDGSSSQSGGRTRGTASPASQRAKGGR